MLRDVFRLQRTAECDPTDCEQQRYFAACRGVSTSGAKSFSYWAPSLRAIAARLQAEHIPPLGLLPFGRTRAQQVAQPSPRTGARSAGCRWHPWVWPAGPKGVHERSSAHILIYIEMASCCEPSPLQSATLTASPKGTPSARALQAVPAHGGAKRGMPVASPGVARRAERGPWAKFRAYFNLHGNGKLLRAVAPSVSCADSFPNLIRHLR